MWSFDFKLFEFLIQIYKNQLFMNFSTFDYSWSEKEMKLKKAFNQELILLCAQ